MNVSLDLYKNFISVAKNKSMTKASEEMSISQPAISKSIKTLENQIGSTLFNRSSKGLELTNEGKMLYDRISIAMNLIVNAENELSSYKKLEEGEIKIGISSVLSKCLIIDTIKNFRTKYPKIKISITNGIVDDLIEKLNFGKLDFVIFNEKENNDYNANIEHLTSLSYVFFYNEKLCQIDDISTIDGLNNHCLILQQKGSNTRDILDIKTNYELKPQIEVMSQDLICNLVDEGLGIGFAFEELVDLNPNFKKIYLPYLDNVNVNIATNKNINPSFAAKTFIKELKYNM